MAFCFMRVQQYGKYGEFRSFVFTAFGQITYTRYLLVTKFKLMSKREKL